MTAREHPSEAQAPTETFTEWGVRWSGGEFTIAELAGLGHEVEAFAFVAKLDPRATVVRRTVTRTEWHQVDLSALAGGRDEIASSEASDGGYGWARRTTDDRGH